MRVHHLDCGSMRPLGGSLIDGKPGLLRRSHMVCHVLLVESDSGLVLVDTGIGETDLAALPGSLPGSFNRLVAPVPDTRFAAVQQVEALGFDRTDVQHIVLTHMDLDHAGGLRDFPHATVHVHGPEHAVATGRKSARDKQRFRDAQWAHDPKWQLYPETGGEPWFGFAAVRELVGLPDDFLLVPLRGHTLGHVGVAVRSDDGWLLHAGDSYFHRGMVKPGEEAVPGGLGFFEKVMQTDGKARAANRERLRELVRDHSAEVDVFCAHDPVELSRFTA